MIKDKLHYFEQRIATERAKVEESSGIVRAAHEKFVAAYQDRVSRWRTSMGPDAGLLD